MRKSVFRRNVLYFRRKTQFRASSLRFSCRNLVYLWFQTFFIIRRHLECRLTRARGQEIGDKNNIRADISHKKYIKDMSVVGFDVGNQCCFIAVARGGGIETIANEYSDRRTPSYVSFGEKQRLSGISAKNQERTNVRNTVSQFKRFIGKEFNDRDVQQEIQSRKIAYGILEQPGGNIGIKVQHLGKEAIFSPEQVMAMLLTNLKTTAEAGGFTKITDCVISVPSYYTDQQRRAMLDSAYMAGLNCLRLMNDTTAAALAYGIYKQDLPEENAKSRIIVFVDFGHSTLQIAVVAFNKGKLKILNTASDANLGGRDFDAALVRHFCKDFQTRYKINVRENAKAFLRLEAECEKLKKVMSSNSIEIPMNIDSYMDDKDVVGRMKRETFENLCSHLLIKVENCLKQLLENSGLKLEEIDAVEIVGGSTRIPAVKNIIQKVLGRETSTTLNTDEAVARGCSLQCAMLSPTFRVREFSMQDVTSYPIKLSWDSVGGEDSGTMDVCERGHNCPFLKQLTFYRKEAFDLNAYYASENPPVLIGRFSVKNVSPTKDGESSKVKVKIRMDLHGIFYVSKAQMIEKLPSDDESSSEPMETQPPSDTADKSAADSQDDHSGNGTAMEDNGHSDNKKEDSAQQPMDTDEVSNDSEGNANKVEQAETNTPEQNAETCQDGTEAPKKGEETPQKQAETPKKQEAQPKAARKKKPTVKTIDLQVEHFVSSLSQVDLNKAIEKECELIMIDKQENDRIHAMNAVEEYVLQTRTKLFEEYEKFITEEEQTSFVRTLEDTENWLYDEGENQKKCVYQEKLAMLKKIGDPVSVRYQESHTRPQALESLGHEIQLCKKMLDLCKQKDEKYEHLEDSEVKKVEDAVTEKEKWLNDTWNKLNQQARHEPPAVLTSDILKEKQKFEALYKPVLNKPKPKPKEEPPKDEKKEEQSDKVDDGNVEDKPPADQETKKEKDVEEENKDSNEKKKPDNMDVD